MNTKSKQEHMYAQALRWIADGEKIEYRYRHWPENRWEDLLTIGGESLLFAEAPGWIFRIKPEPPKTVIINGVECPEPMREAPNYGQRYWIERIDANNFVFSYSLWENTEYETKWLFRGIIHRTEEAARKSCMARHFMLPEQQQLKEAK